MSDNELWSERHKLLIRRIYGMIIGTIMIFMGIWLIPMMASDGFTIVEGAILLSIILLGLTASMPHTFMQVVSNVVSSVGRWRGSSTKDHNGDIDER